MAFDIIARTARLSAANLTLREQARLAQNPNALRWRDIFPSAPTDSVKLSSITTVDFRPVGGRREWNAQGREIPERLGPIVDAEMVPINPTHHIDERRLQQLRERGVGDLVNRGLVNDVDRWATILADAADRQVEVDAFGAWFNNQIVVRDPKTGTTVVVGLGLPADRYPVNATTLAMATNAYDDFLFHLGEAATKLGSVGAVRMRRATLAEIQRDAPNVGGVRLTLEALQDRINAEGYGDVSIVVDERTYDDFTDGGSATTATHYVPAGKMAFQPGDGVVGNTHLAPVTRAYDYIDAAEIENINDVVIFHSALNNGKTLLVEGQLNGLSLPVVSRVYVVSGL